MDARRRPWWRSTYVILASSVLFAAGAIAVGTTLATFSAETDNNTSTLPTGFIGPATGLAVAPSGYDASLTWTPGTHGPVTGQQVYNYDNGSSSSCPASGYSLVATMASAGTSSYTASNPVGTTTLSSNVGETTINPGPGGLNASTTTVPVNTSATFPSVPFVVQVDSEQMNVTASAAGGPGTTNWTVTRGYNSTTATTHANGAAANQVSVAVASHTGFPGSGSYGINVGSENMTVTSGAGTNSWIVTRGANSTTIAAHASGAVVTQVPDPVDGHYYCYEMTSTSATNWTATASFPATQMGLVVKSITLGNAGTSGTIDTNDTITVVFNQAPTGITTGAGRSVCLIDTASPAKIILGDTNAPLCSTTADTNDTGVISGLTVAGGGPMGANAIVNCNASTFSITGSTLTITINSAAGPMGAAGVCQTGNPNPVTTSGSGTYTPASAIKSSAVTDQAPVCENATYSCLPTTSGTF